MSLYAKTPLPIAATQDMIDELTEEKFIGKAGLTIEGVETARVIKLLFELADTVKHNYR